MVEIEFNLKQNITIIQANLTDLFQVIIAKFCGKNKIAPDAAFFIAKGKPINPSKTVGSYMASVDKQDKKLRVLVDILEIDTDKKPVIIKSKDIICPICKEHCRIATENFKIKLFDCTNNHIINRLKIVDFPKTQEINITEIICGKCKIRNKGHSENNDFYRCLTCKLNLCLLCRSNHNSDHYIIKYDLKNYICPKHYDTFIKYCKECHCNICFSCDDEHDEHETISLMEIKPDIKKAKERLANMKKEIEILSNLRNNFGNLEQLVYVIKVMNIYYEINNDILKNYEVKNRNYQTFENVKGKKTQFTQQ